MIVISQFDSAVTGLSGHESDRQIIYHVIMISLKVLKMLDENNNAIIQVCPK